MERVIIDTDPGIDDAVALALAFAHPNLVVEGITIVHGNHFDLDLLARNACVIMEKCSTEKRVLNIPVFKGSSKSLAGNDPSPSGVEFHGENGLGNVPIEPPKNLHLINKEKSAEEFIVETCNKYPNEVTLITLGPLTNIAKALILDQTISTKIKHLSIMAGTFLTPGNVSPVAEANIYNDPEAAAEVFSRKNSKIPISLFPLDTTHLIHMDKEFRENLKATGPVGEFLFEILEHYVNHHISINFDTEKLPTHDSCAVMGVVCPNVFRGKGEKGSDFGSVERVRVEVETKGEWTRGQTLANWNGMWWPGGDENVRIALECDQIKMKQYMLMKFREM